MIYCATQCDFGYFGPKLILFWPKPNNFESLKSKYQISKTLNHVKKWLLKALYTYLYGFGHLDHIWTYIWAKLTNFDSLKFKVQIFMINSSSGLQTIWKSGFVWLSRPIFTVLVIWAKFGPFWTSRSQIAWETPIFYWLPRFCIPKGTWNWPYFGWDIFLHFCLGSKSQETPVDLIRASRVEKMM